MSVSFNDFLILETLFDNPDIHQRNLAKILVRSVANLSRELDRLEKEIDTILDQELALDFICRHINQVTVYREKLDIEFDMLPKCEILIEQINHRKKQMTIKWDISPKQKKMLSKKCSL